MTTVKVLLVGDSGVGKSSIMLRFTTDKFDADISTTIGIDFRVKVVQLENGESLQMQLWDTAGQERFRTLTSSYYRGAHAVALVYDVNEPNTFDSLLRWLDEVRTFCDDTVVLLLIGNKVDLSTGTPNVSRQRAIEFARDHGMLFAQCSAKTKEGVLEAFDELSRKVHDSRVTKKTNGIRLREPAVRTGGQASCC